MSNRWRPEAKLAERLYQDARPYLVSLSNPRARYTPDAFVRAALADGEWAIAVADMLDLGWQPDDATGEEIRRIWINGLRDGALISAYRELRRRHVSKQGGPVAVVAQTGMTVAAQL